MAPTTFLAATAQIASAAATIAARTATAAQAPASVRHAEDEALRCVLANEDRVIAQLRADEIAADMEDDRMQREAAEMVERAILANVISHPLRAKYPRIKVDDAPAAAAA